MATYVFLGRITPTSVLLDASAREFDVRVDAIALHMQVQFDVLGSTVMATVETDALNDFGTLKNYVIEAIASTLDCFSVLRDPIIR